MDWLGAAVAIPVVGLAATWATKKIGKWVGDAVRDSVAESVREIVSPDLQEVMKKIDAVAAQNMSDHSAVSGRLGQVETELQAVKQRLALVESALKLGAAAMIANTGDSAEFQAAAHSMASAIAEDLAIDNPGE